MNLSVGHARDRSSTGGSSIDLQFDGRKRSTNSFSESSRKVSSMMRPIDHMTAQRKNTKYSIAGKSFFRRDISPSRQEIVEEKKGPVLQNTYRMKPNTNFHAQNVLDVMNGCLEKRLEGVHYDPRSSAILCQVLSDDIKMKVKELGFNRHKLICHVTITSSNSQSVTVASRFLWDASVDNHVTTKYDGIDYFLIATLYGVFYE